MGLFNIIDNIGTVIWRVIKFILYFVATFCAFIMSLSSHAPATEIINVFATGVDLADSVVIYSFVGGLYHGIIIPFSVIYKFINWLFDFNWNVGIWADLNNGLRYWIGYIIGASFWILLICLRIYKLKSEGSTFSFRKKIKFFLLIFFFVGILVYIPIYKHYNTIKVPRLQPTQVMNILSYKSIKDGAYYYVNRRENYDFLDDLYCDSIVPVLLEGDFMDLKNVYDIVKGTPAGEILGPWYEDGKYEFKIQLFNTIDSINLESKAYVKSQMPAIMTMVVDSIVEADAHKIVEEYAGGVMNFRKLSLLHNKDKNFSKFNRCIKEVLDESHYEEAMIDYCTSYLYMVLYVQNEFYYEITDKPIKYTQASFPRISLSNNMSDMKPLIDSLTNKECNEVLVDIFKDGVIPIALAVATSGASAVYDVATFAYDGYNVYNDLKEGKLSFNEKLELFVAQNLQNQLEAYFIELENSVCEAIDLHTQYIKNEIEKVL